MVMFRKGKNVILRPLLKEDRAQRLVWLNDPEMTQYITVRRPMTDRMADDWEEMMHKSSRDIVLVIQLIDGPMIGAIGLHGIDHVNGTATTGTFIGDTQYRGKGYATDAKMLLLEYAFNRLNLRKINSEILSFNDASLKYSDRCGYKAEGVRRKQTYVNGAYHDMVLLAVFKEDWLPLWEEYKKGITE